MDRAARSPDNGRLSIGADRMMNRRHFLQAAAGALSAIAPIRRAAAQMAGMPGAGMGGLPGGAPAVGAGVRMGRRLAPSQAWPSGLPLRRLPVLASASTDPGSFAATLVAAPFPASLIAGSPTELWGYQGGHPGPVIELREGQHVAIAFANRLALDSTVHWHGLAVPADQDGSPLDPVGPGAGRLYTFDVPAGSAGTYWYHPHAHGTTTLQVGRGLAGVLIVRDADDPLGFLTETTLMITSLAVGPDGQPTAGMGALGGMTGMPMGGAGPLLVNGQALPVHAMAPGATERWRLVNATADRYLRLALDGHRFTVVGTDGGLLGRPLPDVSEWLLAPAQRLEIVVTIGTRPSARYALRDLGYGGGMAGGVAGELLTVQTTAGAPQAPIALPATLRPVADLGLAAVRQRVVLSHGIGMGGRFRINGALFDPERVDLTTTAGRVELWDLVNTTFMDHPIHVHGTQFQVVGRTAGGLAAPVSYQAWLDTVNVPAGETVTIKTQQTLPGKRMFHCHLLPHEDAGMMAVLDVRPA
jgi:bilirubin oxidase